MRDILKPALAGMVLGATCLAHASQAPDEPSAAPDSAYIQSVLARPVPARLEDQLVIQQILGQGRDLDAAVGLLRSAQVTGWASYIDAELLAKFEGRGWTPAATVKDAIAAGKGMPMPTEARLSAILQSAAKVTRVMDESTPAFVEKKEQTTNRRVAPGLWLTEYAGKRQTLSAALEVRNESRGSVADFDSQILVFADTKLLSQMRCRARDGWRAPIGPSESVALVCIDPWLQNDVSRIPGAIAAWKDEPRSWDFVVDRVQFEDPQLSVTRTEIGYGAPGDRERAHARAVAEMRAVPCEARAACSEEFNQKYFSGGKPFIYLTVVLIVGGTIIGGLIARFAVHVNRWSVGVFLAMCALALYGSIDSGMQEGGYGPLAVVYMFAVSMVPIGIVVLGMFAGIAVVWKMRSKKP